MSSEEIEIEIKDFVVRKGGKDILVIDFFSLKKGEILVLLGPNGAGKTTLINSLALLEKPVKGKYFFRGNAVDYKRDLTYLRRKMGVVMQEAVFLDGTVYGNVEEGLKYRGIERRKRKKIVEDSLEFFGISHLASRPAGSLSGGESAKVNLAMIFALSPEILFFDEPFSSLDPSVREEIISDIEKLIKKSGKTVVFSTHDISEAIRLSTRVIFFEWGRIVQEGTIEELASFPSNQSIANFFGSQVILNCTVTEKKGETFIAQKGNVKIEAVGDVETGQRVALCFRPDDVTIGIFQIDPIKTSARNIFAGTIKKITPFSGYLKVDIDCGFLVSSFVTKNSVENLGLCEGKEVTVTFKATAVKVLQKIR